MKKKKKSEAKEEPSLAPAEPSGVADEALFPDGTTARTPLSQEEAEITNRRYQDDPFWGGPKGIRYGLIVGALPIQQPPLYPDGGSTYFVGNFKMPEHSTLTIKGQYGHERYFSYTVANQLGGGQLGGGDFLRDDEIVPDPDGSANPFLPGVPRDVTSRNYTLTVVQGKAPTPSERPPNTLYTGSDSYQARIHLALRNYIADAGYDGTGNVKLEAAEGYGLPEVILNLPDKAHLTGERMAKVVQASKAKEVAGYTAEEWLRLVEESWDPINAPAVSAPVFQRFWNTAYSITGGFVLDPIARVLEYPATNEGGLAANPDTIYLIAPFSLTFGRVVVIRGKMPTFPRTRHHQKLLTPGQVRYWSLTTGASPPSGVGWMTVFDEEIPLDEDGYYTVVMSWPEDRPKNAIPEKGVKWIDFGGGEGHYIGARAWVNFVYIRYMNCLKHEEWPHSPANIPRPRLEEPTPMDAMVMGEYFPRARYMSKEAFEKLGPKGGR